MKNTSRSPWLIILPLPCPWNKIEHRLFSFISINWRAKPLTKLETVIELISHTTTKEGLQVTAIKDSHPYPTGITVTDVELSALNIVRDSFHGEWNYTIKPQDSPVLLNRKLFTEEPLVALAGEVKQVYGSFPEVDACMGWIQILNPDYKGKGYEYPVNNGRFAGTDAAQFSETVDALLRVCVSRVESYT